MKINADNGWNAILKLFKYTILLPFTAIIIYLIYLAGFSTSITNMDEHTYLIGDSFWLNVLFVAVLILALLLLHKKTDFLNAFIFKVNNDYALYIKCRKIMLSVLFVILAIYVMASQRLGVYDSRDVFTIADEWTRGIYYSIYEGYLIYYPHQLGIVIFLYYFSLFFGGNNYAAFEICNAIGVIFTYRAFAELSDMSGGSRFASLAILAVCILFLPILLYTTFAYGTLLGLCFAVNAVMHIYIYISCDAAKCNGRKTHKWLHLMLSLCELSLAVAIKKNYLIFAIGYIIICTVFFIKKRSLQNFIPVIAAALIVLFSQNVINSLTVKITGYIPHDGMPTMSWVALGLSENDSLYDGWWSVRAQNIIREAQFDKTAAKWIEIEYVQDRLKEFIDDPEYAIRFFSGKNASQWNNPDFNAFHVNNAPSAVTLPEYLDRFFSASTMDTIVRILNPLHFAILAGALFYLLLKKDKSDVSLFYCVVFVGGFIFHTVWEAKGQYTLPYFTLLLPLAVEGYNEVINTVLNFPHLSKKCKIMTISYLTAFLVFGAIINWSNSTLLNDLFVRSEDTESYITYLKDANMKDAE